jgi:hypothetical protein
MAHQYALRSTNLDIFAGSLAIKDGVEYGLAQTDQGHRLVLFASATSTALTAFEGERSEVAGNTLLSCPPNRHKRCVSLPVYS